MASARSCRGARPARTCGSTFQHLVDVHVHGRAVHRRSSRSSGLIGLLHQVARGRYLLPVWIVVVVRRSIRAARRPLMLPAGHADRRGRRRGAPGAGARASASTVPRPRSGHRAWFATGSPASSWSWASCWASSARSRRPTAIASPLHALADRRTARRWPGSRTTRHRRPTSWSSSGSDWFVDANSEWFPVLTGHRSLATLQGYEWLGKGAWDLQADRLRTRSSDACARLAAASRTGRAAAAQPTRGSTCRTSTPDTLSPTGDCCAAFRASLDASPDYELVFSGPGGDVFRPRS